MAHARQQIREQLETTLTGLNTTGSNVFANRAYDTASAHLLPALTIYTLDEDLGEESGNKQMRILNVVIEARAKQSVNLDNTLDTIGAEVESALFASADTTLNGKCKSFNYESMDIALSGEAEQPIGLMTMRFIAQYRVDKTDVETLIS
jgi:hypothetical protein